jgi:hypothetical protein
LVIGIFSQNAHALTYKIDPYPGRPSGPPDYWGGGAFLINESMATYCLELHESISLGSTYFGTIDDFAHKGGVNSGQDYLDVRSEWLVANYLNHSLVNGNRMKDFQNAIWYIEGELGSLPTLLGGTDYYALVSAANAQDIPWIRVLNLYSYDQSGALVDNQSVIITPEPGTLLLLGAGLLGVGFLVRRKIRSLN